jgi:uncharacterized protein YdcH (DUF465 family)
MDDREKLLAKIDELSQELIRLEHEIVLLKTRIRRYEVSTKLDHEKIERLKEENFRLKDIP